MNVRTVLGRLLEALMLAGLAGAIAYGITAWLAPPSVSAKLVGFVVAGIVAVVVLMPVTVTNALQSRGGGTHIDRADSYCDLTVFLTKEEGWKD